MQENQRGFTPECMENVEKNWAGSIQKQAGTREDGTELVASNQQD